MKGLEVRYVCRQELRHRRGVAVHAQHRMAARGVVGHLGAQMVHVGDQVPRQLQQAVACGRKLQAARVALEQLGFELVFQQRQASAGRRDRDVAGLSRAREIAHLCSTHKKSQRVDIREHSVKLCLLCSPCRDPLINLQVN